MKLLDRTREGPKLTEAGRVLVCHAEAAIARLDEAERELAAIAGLEGGELRLASFPSASATLVTEAVASFHGRHPNVRLSDHRRRARGLAAAPARRRARPRARVRLPVSAEAEERDLERTLVLDRVDVRRAAEGPPARRARGRAAGRARRRGVALRLAPEHLRRGRRPGLSRGRLRAADRVRDRRLPRHAGLHLRRARGDAAARPRAADAALRSRRPRDRPAGPERRVWAATRAEGARSPATEEMVSILVEVGARSPRAAASGCAGRLAPRLGVAVGRPGSRRRRPARASVSRSACGSRGAPPGAAPRARPRTTSARGRRGPPTSSPGAGAGCRPRCG